MTRLIEVVDLSSGEALERERGTLTLDMPPDLDPGGPGVFVDAARIGRYRTTGGATRIYRAAPVRLFRRWAGEECMVALEQVDSTAELCTRCYARSVVNPEH
jgi:hypothetical protein